MTQSPPDRKSAPPALTDRARAEKDARLAREAEALRANLRRRKDQSRARAADDAEPPTKG